MYLKAVLQFLIVQLVFGCSLEERGSVHDNFKYYEKTRSCYKTHPTAKTWSDAKLVCAREGANLLVIEDQNEADFIVSYMKEMLAPPTWTSKSRNIYVGISDLETEGAFKTVDGRSILEVYSKWHGTQPDNYLNDEDCVELSDDGRMNDKACSAELPFICKKSRNLEENEVKSPSTHYFREDYKYFDATHSFYKSHATAATPSDAQKKCASENATLLIVEDQDEANFIVAYMKDIADQMTPKPSEHPSIHVGLNDLETEGVFKTIDGRPISEVYSKWFANEPNDAGGNEDCVHMTAKAEFNDIPCNRESPFICKKVLDVKQHNYTAYIVRQWREPFFRKDYKFIGATQSFYKTHTITSKWLEAKRICASENAKLLIVEDQDEAYVVVTYLNETHRYRSVHVGISDLVAKRVFETIDGRSISAVYNKWRATEPNNLGGVEDCVELLDNGLLNDIPCNSSLPFICKKTLESLRWNQICNMSFLDYNYNAKLDRCYKFHENPLNWTDAHALCAAEQSYLAVINSQNEADYLVQLSKQNNKKQSGDYIRGQVFLGFHNRFDEGWTTVRGTAVADSGYVKWATGQPDNDDRDKCGSMFYNGHLNDVACDKKSFFICEHEVGGSKK